MATFDPTRPDDHGYTCKTCGEPSPWGIGFVSYAPGARAATDAAAPHQHPLAETIASRSAILAR